MLTDSQEEALRKLKLNVKNMFPQWDEEQINKFAIYSVKNHLRRAIDVTIIKANAPSRLKQFEELMIDCSDEERATMLFPRTHGSEIAECIGSFVLKYVEACIDGGKCEYGLKIARHWSATFGPARSLEGKAIALRAMLLELVALSSLGLTNECRYHVNCELIERVEWFIRLAMTDNKNSDESDISSGDSEVM